MLRVVTDGAADTPQGWPEEYDFQIIPINIHFGDRTFLSGIDITDVEFYQLARESGVIPKTSQPSPQQFVDFYRRIAEPQDTVLSLHVTSQLSGTFNSAVIAARELKDEIHVIPFDSKAGSAALGFMCREVRESIKAGANIEAILDRLEFIRQRINIMLTLDTLEFARMSGRVKALQAALVSILDIKPIIDLRDGVLDMVGRVRTRRRALTHLLNSMHERVGEEPINAAVVHSLDPASAHKLLQRVRAMFNCNDLIVTDLSIAVAANLGPGTLGLIAYPTDE
jgi:DegV family protein with EDD domain